MILASFIYLFFSIIAFEVDHYQLSCSRASDYGLMKIDESGRILQFAEKPKGSNLKAMVNMLLFNPLWKLI